MLQWMGSSAVTLSAPLHSAASIQQYQVGWPAPYQPFGMLCNAEAVCIRDVTTSTPLGHCRKYEAQNRAVVLEMIGDLPEADSKPPTNMLFVCKLNQVTTEEVKASQSARRAAGLASVLILVGYGVHSN